MHAELAEELGLSTYRVIPTLSVRGGRRGAGHVEAPWLDGDVASATLMDPTPGATAQVTPRELTEALADGARRLGADIRTGVRVVGVATALGSGGENEERVATGVRCVTEGAGEKEEEELVEADAVLVCMGVWSAVASEWFGLPRDAWPLTGIKSTHVVWQSRRAVREDPYALFCAEDEVRAASARVRAQEHKCTCTAHTHAHTLTLSRTRTHTRAQNGCHLEVYPRANGDMYICGIGGSDYVEGDRLREGGDCAAASMVEANPARVEAARRSLSALTSEAAGEPDEVGACMRPCAPDARPLMGGVPGFANAYLSAGHNCWGILWAPVSGAAMAELVLDGASSVASLEAFRPDRFLPRNRRGGRGRKQGSTDVGEQW